MARPFDTFANEVKADWTPEVLEAYYAALGGPAVVKQVEVEPESVEVAV